MADLTKVFVATHVMEHAGTLIGAASTRRELVEDWIKADTSGFDWKIGERDALVDGARYVLVPVARLLVEP